MGSSRVIIVDYDLGNIYNLERAIKYLGGDAVITDNKEIISQAERLILPGVGAFGEGITNLRLKGLVKIIADFILSGRPFLGICLGMQLLMDLSEELGSHEGLGIIKGRVVSLRAIINDDTYKIPNIGWSKLAMPINNGISWEDTILNGIRAEDYMYFVHSYVVVPENIDVILASAFYGEAHFNAVIKQGNMYGCQFHPEKSGEAGLHILNNFLRLH